MNVKNEKLFFSLKNENGVVYQHEISLLDFQFETIKNENVKLYYTLKDIAFDLEEKINLKLKLSGNKIDTEFSIFLSEKNLYHTILEIPLMEEKDIEKNEVELYYIFEKVAKDVISKIMEEHKNLLLVTAERK